MRGKLFARLMSPAIACDRPCISVSSSARTARRITDELTTVAIASTLPTASASPASSPACASQSHTSASPAEQPYTIVSQRAVRRASTQATERPSASST